MDNLNIITPVVRDIVLSLGKTFVLTNDKHKYDLPLDNGRILHVYSWRKGQKCTIVGLVLYDDSVGLEIEFLITDDNGNEDVQTVPISEFVSSFSSESYISTSNLNRGAPQVELSGFENTLVGSDLDLHGMRL
jgi:hypothetical protein